MVKSKRPSFHQGTPGADQEAGNFSSLAVISFWEMMEDNYGVTRGSTNFENTNATSQSFATGSRNRGAAMSTDDLRKQRESRAADALRMKDDQLSMLSEQNRNLFDSLNKVGALFLNVRADV